MTLTYDDLLDAVSGGAVGIRARIALEPLGGPGDKVFPPTYRVGDRAATMYALEERRVPTTCDADAGQPDTTEVVRCVVLDSVPSQANRMELALLDAARRGDIRLPIVSVDFEPHGLHGIGRISSLEAPHRIFDAILRDSLLDGTLFRNSKVGQQITEANARNATALFRYAPHTLVFGGWDSTGPRGGRGAKYERALTSEIVALDAQPGSKTSSRIDPLAIERNAGLLYEAADPSRGTWTLNEEEAKVDRGKKVLVGGTRDRQERGRPSQVNHGNVPPTIDTRAGGITAKEIRATTVLSLIQLRRLGFPVTTDGRPVEPGRRADVEAASRAALAALGLTAVVLAFEQGFDLRSRCVLRATDDLRFELVPRGAGEGPTYKLDSREAIGLLTTATAKAAEHGLAWEDEEVTLQPLDKLVELVRRSQRLAAAEPAA